MSSMMPDPVGAYFGAKTTKTEAKYLTKQIEIQAREDRLKATRLARIANRSVTAVKFTPMIVVGAAVAVVVAVLAFAGGSKGRKR